MKTLLSSSIKIIFLISSVAVLATSLIACNEIKSVENKNTADKTSDGTLHSQTNAVLPTTSLENIENETIEEFEELYLNTEPTASIWPRVRAGFKITSDSQQKELANELKWFAKHPEYIQRVLSRADPFLYYILEEAEKRDLPSELVLLPIVESAYQPFAYSHGRAAGIWQFIPSTGRMYGLKQNWWYDGRRDIYASTQAALNYLERLNKQFKGDWMLALAAYNSGGGTVRKAIKRN